MPTTATAAAAAATQKLGMATASLYGKPSVPVRTPTCTFTATASTALPLRAFSSLPSFSLATNRNPPWRRLAPGACLASLPIYHNCNYANSHNKMTVRNNHLNLNNANIKKSTFLGFTFRAFPPFFPSSSSLYPRNRSSSTRSGSDPSSPSGSGVAAGMGSENKLEGVDWYRNDHLKTAQTQPPSPSTSSNHHHHNKLLTLPTVLTLGRVVAVPLLVTTFYMDSWWGRTATTSIFIAAAVTDWLDGYLARKMKLGSAFGAFLDPVADKLMVAATLILLCSKPLEVGMFGQVPWLMPVPTIAIIGREITMSAVREWAASKSSKLLEAVAVNNLGKWKTATQMIALTILLATRESSLGGPGILVGSGIVFLYISAGLSVWSLAVYMSKIWKVLLK